MSRFAFKMMKSVLNLMNSVSKMMNFVVFQGPVGACSLLKDSSRAPERDQREETLERDQRQ